MGAPDSCIADSEAPPPPPVPLALPFPPLFRPDLGVALRPWGSDARDAAVLAAAWDDPDVARWTAVPAERTEADAARWVRGEAARRDRGLAVDLVITPPGEPDVILGEVGFAVVDPERRWAEVGYWMLPAHRGHGLTTAALQLFTHWVLQDLPIARIFARTHPENPASARVATAAGYGPAGVLADGTQVWVRDAGTVDP